MDGGKRGNMENNLIERYLYDVVRRLPEKQRKDIEEELRTLIEDMLEERQKDRGTEEIKAVLSELGEPAKLAMKYRGEEAHLIGGEYYPIYCQILKLVLICVGVGVAISAVVHLVVQLPAQGGGMNGVVNSVVDGFISLGSLPEALLSAFGLVTLVFFVMERNQVKLQKKEPWSLEKLTQIPSAKAVIPKSDSVVGVFFGVLIMVIFIALPECIGYWGKNADGELVAVSVFNLSIWSKVIPLFVISFSAGVVDDLVKLAVGHYNRTVMYVSIVCSLISVAAVTICLKGYEIFNLHFAEELSAITGETFSAKYDILTHWQSGIASRVLPNFLLAVIVLITLLDLAVTVYRTLRYGQKGKEASCLQ